MVTDSCLSPSCTCGSPTTAGIKHSDTSPCWVEPQVTAAATGHLDGRARRVVVEVVGLPAPQGSKKPFRNKHTGKIAMAESSERVRPWREAVKQATLDVLRLGPEDEHGMAERVGFLFGRGEPVGVSVMFSLPRPASHYGSGRNAAVIKDSAPWWPAGRPDVDKLLRSTLDALGEAGLWFDDSQVVQVVGTKCWTGGAAGARIEVIAL